MGAEPSAVASDEGVNGDSLEKIAVVGDHVTV